jgi:hypothetical protein
MSLENLDGRSPPRKQRRWSNLRLNHVPCSVTRRRIATCIVIRRKVGPFLFGR